MMGDRPSSTPSTSAPAPTELPQATSGDTTQPRDLDRLMQGERANTESNRAHVDERLTQLDAERRAIEQRLAALDEVEFDSGSQTDSLRELSDYLVSLEGALRAGEPEPRARALRRCMLEIVVDAAAEH